MNICDKFSRAALYMRFSTELQTENSIDTQRRCCVEYAKREGIEIVCEYADRAISGKTDKRPEFQRMVDDIINRRIDVGIVLVYKLDRFARNEKLHHRYEEVLQKHNVLLFSATEPVNSDKFGQRITKAVMAVMNEEEVRKISENVSRGKKETAYKGLWCGGTPPLGYDVDEKTHTLVLNTTEAKAVKLAFELRASGFSYSYIIGELNKAGYKTKLGNRFGKNSLTDIFRNIKYKGIYEYNRAASKSPNGTFNRHASKDESEIIKIPGGCPRIVSDEVWDKVNGLTGSANRPKGDYLLSGLVKCKCGATMQVNRRKNRDRNRIYSSFFCPEHKSTGNCDGKEINMDTLTDFVVYQLAEKIFTPAIIDSFKTAFPALNKERLTQAKRKVKVLERKISTNDTTEEKYMKAIENSTSENSMQLFVNKINWLTEENERLNREITEKKAALPADPPSTDEIMALKQDFITFMLDENNLPICKKCLQSLIEGIFIYDDEIKIVFNI